MSLQSVYSLPAGFFLCFSNLSSCHFCISFYFQICIPNSSWTSTKQESLPMDTTHLLKKEFINHLLIFEQALLDSTFITDELSRWFFQTNSAFSTKTSPVPTKRLTISPFQYRIKNVGERFCLNKRGITVIKKKKVNLPKK